jgi:glycosyltransferase involved in cell wall biosynthesis
MNLKLSIIIPSYNEFSNTIKTVNNILEKCDNRKEIEIIIVDDNSNEDYSTLSKNNFIKYIKNHKNIGTSQSRNTGIKLAESKYILTIDAHVKFFKKGFDKEIIEKIISNSSSVMCLPCMDVDNNKVYYAGGFNFLNIKNPESFLSPFLLNNEEIREEIPCIIGGAYFFNKDWYQHLNGMEGMIGWGVGETFLSLKSYLAGGDCKLVKNIKIGHSFKKGNYTINKRDLYYNKIFISQTILPLDISAFLLTLLPNNKEKEDALNLFKEKSIEILKNRISYEYIFKINFADYIKKFNLA